VAFKQEVNVPLILTIGIISAVMLIVSIVGTEAWYDSEEQAEITAKAAEYPNQVLLDLKEAQKTKISAYRWVDKKNNVVAIPIENAMRVLVETKGQLPSTRPTMNASR
jgi:hypothetical protein